MMRLLKKTKPPMIGADVRELQSRLLALGYRELSQVDAIFGQGTQQAVRHFQRDGGLIADGVVGPKTWATLTKAARKTSFPSLSELWRELGIFHGMFNSVEWRLTKQGIAIKGSGIERSGGKPRAVEKIWAAYGEAINLWATYYQVPAELILATICTESAGNTAALRKEPGYTSDHATPHRISTGLMQTLISTARWILKNDAIDRAWLMVPENAIQAGTAYIASQKMKTHFDAPKVACAYNAGGVYAQTGLENRWKMRQYPIGSAHHADRFIKWFNDFIYLINHNAPTISYSFFNLPGAVKL